MSDFEKVLKKAKEYDKKNPANNTPMAAVAKKIAADERANKKAVQNSKKASAAKSQAEKSQKVSAVDKRMAAKDASWGNTQGVKVPKKSASVKKNQSTGASKYKKPLPKVKDTTYTLTSKKPPKKTATNKIDAEIAQAYGKKTGPVTQRLDDETQYMMDKIFAESTAGRVFDASMESFLNNTVGVPYQIVKGEKLFKPTQAMIDTGGTETTAYKVGDLIGNIAAFALPYGAAGKAMGKAADVVMKTKLAQQAVGKVGQKVGTQVAGKVAREAVKDFIGDSTIGLVQNVALARGEGLEGEELVGDVAKNQAFDYALGGVIDAVPAVKKAVSPRVSAWKESRAAAKAERRAAKEVSQDVAEETTERVVKDAEPVSEQVSTPVRDVPEMETDNAGKIVGEEKSYSGGNRDAVRKVPKEKPKPKKKHFEQVKEVKESVRSKIGFDKYSNAKSINDGYSSLVTKAKKGTLTDEDIMSFANVMLEEAKIVDSSMEEAYGDLKRAIKSTPLKISDEIRANIPDWNDFRKAHFGSLNLKKDGIPVDSFYAEMQAEFPGVFPDVNSVPEMVENLADVARRSQVEEYSITKLCDDAEDMEALFDDTVKALKDSLNEITEAYMPKSFTKQEMRANLRQTPATKKVLKANGADVNRNPPKYQKSKSVSQSYLPDDEKVVYEKETHAQRESDAKQRLDVDYEGEYKDMLNKEKFNTEDTATVAQILEKEAEKGNVSRLKQMARKAVEQASSSGQELEAFKHISDRSPQGKILKAQRIAKQAERRLKKTNPKVLDMSDKQAEQIINIIDESRGYATKDTFSSLMKRYKESSIDRLEKMFSASVEGKKGVKNTPALQKAYDDMVNELSQIVESAGSAAEKEAKISKLFKQVQQAQNNPKEYAYVLGRAKTALYNKYKNNKELYARAKSIIDSEYKNYTEKALQAAVDEQIKAMGKSITDIARSNRTDKAKALEEIKQFIIKESGADEKTAKSMADDISVYFDEIVEGKRDALINKKLTPAQKKVQESVYKKAAGDINTSYIFMDDSISKSVEQALKDAEIDVSKLIKKGNVEKTEVETLISDTVSKKLKEAGVGEEYVDEIANQAKKTYRDLLQEKSKKELTNRFKERTLKAKNKKTLFEDVQELINMGAYNDADIVDMMRARNNIPVLTPAQADKIVHYMKKAEAESDPYKKTMWEARAEQVVSDIDEVTAKEKFRSLQRILLLSNPKTLITRNMGGNILLSAAENIKDIPASAVDRLISLKTGERTTSGLTYSKIKNQVSGIKKGITEQAKDIKYGVDTSPSRGQYELPNKTIWQTEGKHGASKVANQTMKFLDNVISKSLQFGDRPFYEAAYKARKAELEKFVKQGKSKLTAEEIEESARLFALDKTFQSDTYIARAAKKIRDAIPGFGDLIMPFTQTPANILDKLIDYSPAGMVKAIKELGNIKKGTFDQKHFVDLIGRMFTGGGAILLGYELYNKGILTGDLYNESKTEEYNAKKFAGEQDYSLKLGDSYYSISWADPVGSLLMMGADAAHAQATDEELLQTIYGSVVNAADGVFERSFLSGLFDLFGNVENDGVVEGFGSTIFNQSTSQISPNIGTSITKIIDPVQRETYDSDPIKQALNKFKSKTPFLSQTLPAKKGITGETVYQYQGRDTKDRALESLLLPYSRSDENHDSTNDFLMKLYKDTGEVGVLLDKADKKFNYKGTTYTLENAEEYSKYQEKLGKYCVEAVNKTRKAPGFKDKSKEAQARAISNALSAAKTKAKEEYLIKKGHTTRTEIEFSNLSNSKQARYDSGKIKKKDYIQYFNNVDANGNGGVTQDEARAMLDSMDLSAEQKAYLWSVTNKGWKAKY